MNNKNGSCSRSTSDVYENLCSDSDSTELIINECRPANTEGNKMSLCFAFALYNKVYLVADSRSSEPDINSEIGNFSHRRLKYKVVSDKYRKIFKLPILDRNIVGFSTGKNNFSESICNLSDFIKQIKFPKGLTLVQYASILGTEAILRSNNVCFELFEYSKENLYRASISVFNNNLTVFSELYQPKENDAYYTSSGAEWAKQLLNTEHYVIPETNPNDESYNIRAFENIYKKASSIGCVFDDSVGGPICIGKLTPDGFTWLQNGYEL